MSYHDVEQTRLRRQSSKQAIALALQGQWREAVAANKSILESFPNDVDAYNRLGRAYLELGKYTLAREAYESTIKLDPYNSIARKNFDRLTHLGDTEVSAEGGFHKVEPQQFIEEVGKAGVLKLYRVASPEILARTVAGAKVNLRVSGSSLIVENSRGECLGQVEPNHGRRLVKLMGGGNRYSAAIVSSTEEAVAVIIREEYQDPSQAGRLSFPPRGDEIVRPYVEERIGDRIIRREIKHEEALPGEASYTIIGGEETEVFSEESTDADEVEDEE
ncbi:tetratricopeptide repeat protein [Chloroflexota bacterium]